MVKAEMRKAEAGSESSEVDSRSCVAAVVVAEAGERMMDVGWWMLWETDGEKWRKKRGGDWFMDDG